MKLLEFYEYVSKNLFSNIYYIHRLCFFFSNRCKSVEPFCEKRTVKIIVAVVEQWLCVMGSSLQSSLKHLSKNVHHIYKKKTKIKLHLSYLYDRINTFLTSGSHNTVGKTFTFLYVYVHRFGPE